MQKSSNDPELQEWLDALTNIISEDGNDRASFILGKLASELTALGTIPNYNLTTPFRNYYSCKRRSQDAWGFIYGEKN